MTGKRVRPRLLLAVGLALAIVTAIGVTAPCLGLFLVVADRLQPSDAIFVLDGGTPARELEAAALYHRRLAPRVMIALPREALAGVTRKLAGERTSQEHSAWVLAHVHVPEKAIVRLTTIVENTEEELRADYTYARTAGFRRIIIVTAPYHTRRVRLMWDRHYERDVSALVHPTPYEDFDPARWWRSRRALEATAHEMFGMANYFLGSPLPTYDRR
ncbi:MAG TPA: ElyC/SanA/YdcF family protein [Methylomirabilota bacterium]|jgi:uncharacterized SAM-binding protein YcdF (DUF218 family)